MASVIAKTMAKQIGSMPLEDRVAVALELVQDRKVAERVALVVIGETEERVETHAGEARKTRSGRPFWLKLPEGINTKETRMSAYRLIGKWVYRPSEMPDGTVLVLGMRVHDDSVASYGLVKVKSGGTVHWPNGVEVANVELVSAAADWKELEQLLKVHGICDEEVA